MNDKKKLMIVGALVLVMLAVGAFQFMTPAASPAATKAAEVEKAAKEAEGIGKPGEEKKEGEEPVIDPALAPLIAQTFPSRDPFMPPSGAVTMQDIAKPVVQTPAPSMSPPPANPVTGPSSNPAPPRSRPRNSDPLPPLGGSLPRGGLPPANPGSIPTGNPGPDRPMVITPTFRLKGVMLGNRPLAVFEDSKGNQKLVPLGGSLDAETTVVAIERGKVTVRSKGKDRTLVIEEEARD